MLHKEPTSLVSGDSGTDLAVDLELPVFVIDFVKYHPQLVEQPFIS